MTMLEDLRYLRLTRLAVPAMINNAAAPIAAMVNVALISHAAETHKDSTKQIAAYALVSGTIGFSVNIFNFVITVTMSQVGHSVGAKRWGEVGRKVRAALMVAVVTGLLCSGIVYLTRDYIFDLFSATDNVRHEARTYFLLRLATVPFLFICRVCSGVLGGYQRVNIVTAANVVMSALDVMGNYVALHMYSAALKGSGYATFAATVFGALLLLVVMTIVSPKEVTWLPQCGSSVDSSGHQTQHSETSSSIISTLKAYLASSGNMMVRSLMLQGCVFALYILASKLGTEELAAHQIIFQLWSLTSYICDGFADVGTMLGSKLLGGGDAKTLNRLADRLLIMGLVVGAIVTIVMYAAKNTAQDIFTHDPQVRIVLNHNWILLCAMQMLNATVFVYDGVLYAFGQDGFRFIRNLMLIGCIGIFTPGIAIAYTQFHTVLSLWVVKNILTLWRCGTAVWYVDIWHRYNRVEEKDGATEETTSDIALNDKTPLLINREHQEEV